MRLLTLLAVAVVATEIYRYQKRHAPARRRALTPEQRLAQEVRLAIDAPQIEVRALNGVVTLTGTVATVSERDRVLAATLAVPGVTQVTNLLDTEEPIGEIGTLQSGMATGA